MSTPGSSVGGHDTVDRSVLLLNSFSTHILCSRHLGSMLTAPASQVELKEMS